MSEPFVPSAMGVFDEPAFLVGCEASPSDSSPSDKLDDVVEDGRDVGESYSELSVKEKGANDDSTGEGRCAIASLLSHVRPYSSMARLPSLLISMLFLMMRFGEE